MSRSKSPWPENLLADIIKRARPDQVSRIPVSLPENIILAIIKPHLTDREYVFIIVRYFYRAPIFAMADIYSLPESRVRQIISKSLSKLKRPEVWKEAPNGMD